MVSWADAREGRLDGRERKAYHVRANLLAGDLVVDDHFSFAGLVTGRGWLRGYGVCWRFNAVCWGRSGRARAELLGGDFAEEELCHTAGSSLWLMRVAFPCRSYSCDV